MTLKKYIPDAITSMNLICGLVGVMFAVNGKLDLAFYLMLAAAVADFLDGFFARLLNAYSDFGKELDSLCDLVSFGVLPSVMLWSLMKTCMFGESLLCYVPLVIALFSALRLAKFNVDDAQKDGFLGLPTPACALLCASLCMYICNDPACFLADWAAGNVFIPLLSVCLSLLLVSRIPMFSFKFRKDDASVLKTKRFAYLVMMFLLAGVCLIYSLNWSAVILMGIVLYIVKNIVYFIARI